MAWFKPPVRRTGALLASSYSVPVLEIAATGKDCGCGKRKEWLNDKIPFRRREGEH